MLASEVMNRAAALLNDVNRTIYTYEAQIPYINMAVDDLQEEMENHHLAVTREVSSLFTLTAGNTQIVPLPAGLVAIQKVSESDNGVDWAELRKADYLPDNMRQTNYLTWWSFQANELRFIGALGEKYIKLEYISKIQPPIADENTNITIINSKSFLAYRTAALCSEFIGENKTRADSLNENAVRAVGTVLGLAVKEEQIQPVRRLPFMSGYKGRR